MKGSKKDYQMTAIRIDPTVKKQLRFIAVEREAHLVDIVGEILLQGLEEYKRQYGLDAKEPPQNKRTA
jgi:hypothetical protein